MSSMEDVNVADVKAGDVVAFDRFEPVWVTALKVKADRYGFDMLYQPDDAGPRWRGFDDGDHVLRRAS